MWNADETQNHSKVCIINYYTNVPAADTKTTITSVKLRPQLPSKLNGIITGLKNKNVFTILHSKLM